MSRLESSLHISRAALRLLRFHRCEAHQPANVNAGNRRVLHVSEGWSGGVDWEGRYKKVLKLSSRGGR